ncbi:MAG: hypothetical protein K2Q06_12920, partial [Parvularculaceae bacterium]|nr:hypothetical protein [Parvularculaceae bacterium]
WNGPFEPFERASLVVVRSTWDYWDAPGEFRAWLEKLKSLPHVANDPALMLWNLDKRYLLDLAARGAPLPPTRLVAPDPDAIAQAMDALELDEAVAKPTVSAGAFGLNRVRREDRAGLAAAARDLGGPGLVQPLIREIVTAGETSLVYFGGVFSHAVVKHPKSGDIRIQEQHGGATRPAVAPEWAVAEGRRILSMLPANALYARVDVVLRDAPGLDPALWLMEVEVLEPSLYLSHAPPGSAEAFAAALLRNME